MDAASVTQLIIEYRYWILIPLSFIEGPIVAFIAGTLASVGYFNVYLLAVLFLVRDVAVDLLMYAIGFYGGRTAFAHRMLKRFGVDDKEFADIKLLWNKHAFSTMFFSKLSYGVAAAFIMIAGMVEMPLKKFVTYAFLIAVAHYGVLLFVGYYFGNTFGSIEGILTNIQYVILGAAIVFTVYFLFKRYINKKMRLAEKEAEKEIEESKHLQQ
jgi:membrane protein DedA with SNARE-associated domain